MKRNLPPLLIPACPTTCENLQTPFEEAVSKFSFDPDKTHVGMLRDGGYFVLGARPGVHRYAVRQGRGEVSLYAESGKRYFVRLHWTGKREDSGLATQNVLLKIEDEQDAVRELRKHRPNALAEP
jgi:hypothetical protein